jgi:hypothetical protein
VPKYEIFVTEHFSKVFEVAASDPDEAVALIYNGVETLLGYRSREASDEALYPDNPDGSRIPVVEVRDPEELVTLLKEDCTLSEVEYIKDEEGNYVG